VGGRCGVDGVELSRDLWFHLVRSAAGSEAGASRVASAERAERLLRVALRCCRPPSSDLAGELWSVVIESRSVRAARVFRDCSLPIGPEASEVFLGDWAGLSEANSDQLVAAHRPAQPGCCGRESQQQTLDLSFSLETATTAVPVATVDKLLYEASTANDRGDLIAEIAAVKEVREHLDVTVQLDCQEHLQPPKAMTPRSRAERTYGLAARLLGRAALREQGVPITQVTLQPPKPVLRPNTTKHAVPASPADVEVVLTTRLPPPSEHGLPPHS